MRSLILIGFVLHSLLSCSNETEPVFNRIPNDYFISGTPTDNASLKMYSCTRCSFAIDYVENVDTYKSYFIVNNKTFDINELLVAERMEFYNVSYFSKLYLLVSSPDFSSSGKAYSINKNYYLFSLNKENQAISLEKIIDNKSTMKSVFLESVNKQ